MTPTNDLFWPYMLPVLERQKAKNNVVYIQKSDGNGMYRLFEDSSSEDVYPGIFMMLPKYSTKKVENHILMVDFQTVFYVWCQPEDNNIREDQNAAYAHAEKIAADIIARLQKENREYKNFLDFDSIRMEPVQYLSADAVYGYEVTLRLGLSGNEIFG